MPKTSYGKWSVGCIVAMLLFFSIRPLVFKYVFDSAPSESLIGRYLMENLFRGGFAAGLSALMLGLISIFDQKDRGIWVIISTVMGAFATAFFVILFFSPHQKFLIPIYDLIERMLMPAAFM